MAQYDKVEFPLQNIRTWTHLGNFASHFGCARACMKAEATEECQVHCYSTSNVSHSASARGLGGLFVVAPDFHLK